jgi:hypothetical protein
MADTSTIDKKTDPRPLMVFGCIVLLLLFITYLFGGEDSVEKNVSMWGVYTAEKIKDIHEVIDILAERCANVPPQESGNIPGLIFSITHFEEKPEIPIEGRVFTSGQLIRVKPQERYKLVFTMCNSKMETIESVQGNELMFQIDRPGTYYLKIDRVSGEFKDLNPSTKITIK